MAATTYTLTSDIYLLRLCADRERDSDDDEDTQYESMNLKDCEDEHVVAELRKFIADRMNAIENLALGLAQFIDGGSTLRDNITRIWAEIPDEDAMLKILCHSNVPLSEEQLDMLVEFIDTQLKKGWGADFHESPFYKHYYVYLDIVQFWSDKTRLDNKKRKRR